MPFSAALLTVPGEAGAITFAVVAVDAAVVTHPETARRMVTTAQAVFGAVPVVLMVNSPPPGLPRFHGRLDLVRFLDRIGPQALHFHSFAQPGEPPPAD